MTSPWLSSYVNSTITTDDLEEYITDETYRQFRYSKENQADSLLSSKSYLLNPCMRDETYGELKFSSENQLDSLLSSKSYLLNPVTTDETYRELKFSSENQVDSLVSDTSYFRKPLITAKTYRQFKFSKENHVNYSVPNNSYLKKSVKRLDNSNKKKTWKLDKPNLPVGIKKPTKFKDLRPINPISLLAQIKPEVRFKFIQDHQTSSSTFTCHAEHGNGILATGVATAKAQAKTIAAENALKSIFKAARDKSLDKTDDGVCQDNEELIPIACYALYKLFKEWDVNDNTTSVKVNRVTKSAKKITKLKELPQNALEIHPATLLNEMMPGTNAIEVRRTQDPEPKVTMGFKIDGILYTGTARNRKDAKKEAAKVVLQKFYNINYSSKDETEKTV